MRPAAVDESMPSVVETKVTPRSVNALTVKDVQGIAAQAIELPDHDGVALANVVKERGQTRTVILRPRHSVGEGLGGSSPSSAASC